MNRPAAPVPALLGREGLPPVLCTPCHERGTPDRLAEFSNQSRTIHYCPFCALEQEPQP